MLILQFLDVFAANNFLFYDTWVIITHFYDIYPTTQVMHFVNIKEYILKVATKFAVDSIVNYCFLINNNKLYIFSQLHNNDMSK